MKDVWVLTIKTSLPGTCQTSAECTTTCAAFDSFEKGRDALREAVRGFAFGKNRMFDGAGNIIQLKEYTDDSYDEEEDFEDGTLYQVVLTYITDCLRSAFNGEDVDFTTPLTHYDDWMLAADIRDGELVMYGTDDGPCNGVTPDIRTNIFSMKEDKHYYLYVDDMFGQDDCSAELYVDLQKATVQ